MRSLTLYLPLHRWSFRPVAATGGGRVSLGDERAIHSSGDSMIVIDCFRGEAFEPVLCGERVVFPDSFPEGTTREEASKVYDLMFSGWDYDPVHRRKLAGRRFRDGQPCESEWGSVVNGKFVPHPLEPNYRKWNQIPVAEYLKDAREILESRRRRGPM